MKKTFIFSTLVTLALVSGCGEQGSRGVMPEDDPMGDPTAVADGGSWEVPPPYNGIAFDLGSGPESPPDGWYCVSDDDCWDGWVCVNGDGETAGKCYPPAPTSSPWFGACDVLDCEPSAHCYLTDSNSVCAPDCALAEAEFPPNRVDTMECLSEGLVQLCDTDNDCHEANWNLMDSVCVHGALSTQSGQGVCMHNFQDSD